MKKTLISTLLLSFLLTGQSFSQSLLPALESMPMSKEAYLNLKDGQRIKGKIMYTISGRGVNKVALKDEKGTKHEYKAPQIDEFGTDAISYGKGPGNKDHRLIIINPEGDKEAKSIIKQTTLKNTAYSSSGNFERFYVDDKGFKHSHLLDPRTGRPIENKILSAHIKAPTCTQADALATICMILTLEESQQIITADPKLEGLIVYNDKGNLAAWKSAGFDLNE